MNVIKKIMKKKEKTVDPKSMPSTGFAFVIFQKVS
jgi:hypothetical protein